MKRPALVAAILLTAAAVPGCESLDFGRLTEEPPDRVYLATYFLDNGQNGALLAVSRDGMRFEPILTPNVPILAPTAGREKLMRDPCILRGPDGTWHMVWTTSWNDRGIGLAHSPDLVNWHGQRLVEVMGSTTGAVNCWAPELAYDAERDEFLILWSSTVLGAFPETERAGDPQIGAGPEGPRFNHRIYFTTTRDFKTFAPERLYYNPGFNCIDATLLPPESPGAPWHLFIKDETLRPPAKNLRHLALTDPREAAGQPSPPITGTDYWAEGPTAIRIARPPGPSQAATPPTVRVYFDRYAINRFGAVETTDFETWTDISDRIRFPKDARHGTVIEVDREFVEQVRESLRARRFAAAPGLQSR